MNYRQKKHDNQHDKKYPSFWSWQYENGIDLVIMFSFTVQPDAILGAANQKKKHIGINVKMCGVSHETWQLVNSLECLFPLFVKLFDIKDQ